MQLACLDSSFFLNAAAPINHQNHLHMILYVVLSSFISGAAALGLTWSYSQDAIKWALRWPTRLNQQERQYGLPLAMFAGLALSMVPGFWISLQDSVSLKMLTPLVIFVFVPIAGYVLLFCLAGANLLIDGISLFFDWCNSRGGCNPPAPVSESSADTVGKSAQAEVAEKTPPSVQEPENKA